MIPTLKTKPFQSLQPNLAQLNTILGGLLSLLAALSLDGLNQQLAKLAIQVLAAASHYPGIKSLTSQAG